MFFLLDTQAQLEGEVATFDSGNYDTHCAISA